VVFRRVDLEALHLPEGSIDALLAVDVLAHLDDPRDLLRRGYGALVPGGCWILLGSELDGASRFAGTLAGLGARVRVVDLSRLEGRLWERQARAAAELREVYAAEGREDLWRLLWDEAERGLRWAREGRARRYLLWALKA
jgi:SAM-dependent methyltransferase